MKPPKTCTLCLKRPTAWRFDTKVGKTKLRLFWCDVCRKKNVRGTLVRRAHTDPWAMMGKLVALA
jgi:hypothetical protein